MAASPLNTNLYLGLMEEIKLRVENIDGICRYSEGIPGKLVLEFSFLQLRMVCEVLAMACLVAHGDHKGAITRTLRKEGDCRIVMNELEGLNENFFPRAVKIETTWDGLDFVSDIDPQPLTRESFKSLYGRCGDAVHRGNLEKLLKHPAKAAPISFDPALKATEKVCALLNVHRIASPNGDRQIICRMKGGPEGMAALLIASR